MGQGHSHLHNDTMTDKVHPVEMEWRQTWNKLVNVNFSWSTVILHSHFRAQPSLPARRRARSVSSLMRTVVTSSGVTRNIVPRPKLCDLIRIMKKNPYRNLPGKRPLKNLVTLLYSYYILQGALARKIAVFVYGGV